MAGQTIRIEWNYTDVEDNDVRRFIIHHNFPNYESPISVDGDVVAYVFKNVGAGTYFAEIQAENTFGTKSNPLVRTIVVPYNIVDNVARFPLNLPYGATSNSKLEISKKASGMPVIRFQKSNYLVQGTHPLSKDFLNTSVGSGSYSQNISLIPSLTELPTREDEGAAEFIDGYHYVLFKPSEPTNPLKLVKFNEAQIEGPTGVGYGRDYWYDTGGGSLKPLENFTNLTGTIGRKEQSSTIFGRGTNFTSEVEVGDLLKSPVTVSYTFRQSNTDIDWDADTITISSDHVIAKGDPVTITKTAGGAVDVGGITSGTTYFAYPMDEDKIRLFNTKQNALDANDSSGHASGRINLTLSTIYGSTHEINATYDHNYLGRVTSIKNDSQLTVDNIDNKVGFAGESVARLNLRLNLVDDFIVGRVTKVGSKYISKSYITVDADKEEFVPPPQVTIGDDSSETANIKNLLHYFPFNKVVGSSITDTIGNATASITGSNFSVSANSPIGNSIDLNDNTAIELLSSAEADTWMAGSWSVAFWAKSEKDDASVTQNSNEARLISRDVRNYWGLVIDQDSTQEIELRYKGNGLESISLGALPSKGEWHHIGVSWDGTTLKAFLDGRLMGASTTYAPASVARPLAMGCNVLSSISSNEYNFIGKLTEVRLYEGALSENDMMGLYTFPGASNDTAIKDTSIKLGASQNALTLNEQGIFLGDVDFASAPFSVTTAGAVKATSGTIGGWTLSASSFHSGNSPDTTEYASSGITLSAHGTMHTPEFYINSSGGAFFKGNITASSGNIGGWAISGSTISASNAVTADDLSIMSSFGNSGYINGLSPDVSGIIFHNQGSIHSKNFFINSDGSASFSGDISGAIGTFNGGLVDQSVTADKLADGTVTFREIADKTIKSANLSSSDQFAVYSITTGNPDSSNFSALDGLDANFSLYAGSNAGGSAPFRVSRAGKLVSSNSQLYDNTSKGLYFDSNATGLQPLAYSEIAKELSSSVYTFSKPFSNSATDFSDLSTFQKITLDAQTDLTGRLRIPVSDVYSTAYAEYYSFASNPLELEINVSSVDNTSPFTDTSITGTTVIKKPDGSTRGTPFVGELIRLNLKNTVPGMALTSVTGAVNPVTGSAYDTSTPIDIAANQTSAFIVFEMSAGANFEFSISSINTGNISYDSNVNNATKPDTVTTARNALPSNIAANLYRNTTDSTSGGTTLSQLSVSSTNTAAGIASNQYLLKTTIQDATDESRIFSTVGIELNTGAVDAQGFINTEQTQTLAADDYWYYGDLTVTNGTDSSLSPTTKIFEAEVPSTAKPLKVFSNRLAQQGTGEFSSLDLNGPLTVPFSASVTPDDGSSGSAGTVTIVGNLHVTGTQTSVSQATLNVTGKTVTVADGATQRSDANGAGLVVDFINESIKWNESQSSFVATSGLTSSSFRVGNGSDNNVAIGFRTKADNVGIFTTAGSYGGAYGSGTAIHFRTENGKSLVVSDNGVDITQGNLTLNTSVSLRKKGADLNFAPWNNTYNTVFRAGTGTDGDSNSGDNRLYIKSASARLGIHNADPQALLHLTSTHGLRANNKTPTASYSFGTKNILMIEGANNENTGILIAPGTGADSDAIIQLTAPNDASSVNQARIAYNPVRHEFSIRHEGSELTDNHANQRAKQPLFISTPNEMGFNVSQHATEYPGELGEGEGGLELVHTGYHGSSYGMGPTLSFRSRMSNSSYGWRGDGTVIRAAIEGGDDKPATTNGGYGFLAFYTSNTGPANSSTDYEGTNFNTTRRVIYIDNRGFMHIKPPPAHDYTGTIDHKATSALVVGGAGAATLNHHTGILVDIGTAGGVGDKATIRFGANDETYVSSGSRSQRCSGVGGRRYDASHSIGLTFYTSRLGGQMSAKMYLSDHGNLSIGSEEDPESRLELGSTVGMDCQDSVVCENGSQTYSIASFDATRWHAAKALVVIRDSVGNQPTAPHVFSSELLIINDGDTTDNNTMPITEYAVVDNNSSGTRDNTIVARYDATTSRVFIDVVFTGDAAAEGSRRATAFIQAVKI